MSTTVAHALRELHDTIRGFDLPIHKKVATTPSELDWLARNMGVRNSADPLFADAMAKLKQILRAIRS